MHYKNNKKDNVKPVYAKEDNTYVIKSKIRIEKCTMNEYDIMKIN